MQILWESSQRELGKPQAGVLSSGTQPLVTGVALEVEEVPWDPGEQQGQNHAHQNQELQQAAVAMSQGVQELVQVQGVPL